MDNNIMKLKCRKLGIFVRFMLLSGILTLISTGTVGINSTLRRQQETTETARKLVDETSKLAANLIDTDMVQAAIEHDEAALAELTEYLGYVIEHSDALYVYSLIKVDDKWLYLADGSAEDRAESFTEYDVDFDILDAVLNGKNYQSEDFEEYDGAYIMTAYYAVVPHGTNEPIAVIGADIDVSIYKQRIIAFWEWLFGLTAATVLFSTVVISIITWLITRNIRRVAAKIMEINQSDGDLTAKLEIKSGDEVEVLADNLNQLLDYIRDIVNNVKLNAAKLNDANVTLDKAVATQTDATQMTAATMEEMSAATQEISASLTTITGNIMEATENTTAINNQVAQMTANADNIIKAVNAKADAIKQQADLTRSQVTEMINAVQLKLEASKQVEQITSLTDAILDVASQTNLLSLNASIEAARAGEAGKGFAVVASEIQKLANNSAQTAANIQQVTSKVVEAVEQLIEISSQFTEFTRVATEEQFTELASISESYTTDTTDFKNAFDHMSGATATLQEYMDSISTAVKAVGIAVDENAEGISNVAESTSQMSSDIQTIADIVQENSNIVEAVTTEMNKFKS